MIANSPRDLQCIDFEKKLDLAIFQNLRDPKAKVISKTKKDVIQIITTPIETLEKGSVPLLGFYRLNREQRRANKNVESISALVLDIDKAQGFKFEQIYESLKKYQCVIHTTYSNSVDRLSLRVIVFLTRPIFPHEYLEVWKAFIFFSGLQGLVDESCKDLSRAYYSPSYSPENRDLARCFTMLGQPVNPEHFNNKRPLSALAKSFCGTTYQDTKDNSDVGLVAPGGRNTTLYKLSAGWFSGGLTTDQVVEKAHQWNQALSEPLDEHEVYRVCENAEKYRKGREIRRSEDVVNHQASSFEFIPASKLLSSLPVPRSYLIDEFLPARLVSLLIAPGGTGKSMLILLIAVCVAAGIPLFGRFPVQQAKKVLLISGEDDNEEIQRRLHKILAGESEEIKTLVGKNLFFLDLSDRFELFTEKPPHGETRITDVPDRIVHELSNQIGSDFSLAIVDPGARFRGGEENLAADTTRFVQALQLIRNLLNAAVLVVHHVNKSAKGSISSQNNARGSSALIDGVRLVYELNLMSEQEIVKRFGSINLGTPLLTLSCVKTNYGKPIDPIIIERLDNGTLALASKLPSDIQNSLILSEIQRSPMSKSAFKEKFGGTKNKFGISEKILLVKLTELESKGYLKIPARGDMSLTKSGVALLTNDLSGN
jgi:RecA-family ATPase